MNCSLSQFLIGFVRETGRLPLGLDTVFDINRDEKTTLIFFYDSNSSNLYCIICILFLTVCNIHQYLKKKI